MLLYFVSLERDYMNKVDKTIMDNEFKLVFFIGLTSAIIIFLGYIISEIFGYGMTGVYASFFIAAITNFISFFFSKTIVLKSQKAIPMKESEFPEYVNMVKSLCANNNIKLPELYYIKSSALNAFATGRSQNDAAVVVTSGLLEKVPLDEISGVIRHELSHILHKDIMITSFVSILVGYITIVASSLRNASMYNSRRKNSDGAIVAVGIAASILAPIVGMLIRMAVSRSREYMADATGGQICGNPLLLAKALYRISHDGSEMPMANEAVAPLYISNPLKNNVLANLMSTHPDINDRIQRLESMAS